MATHPFLKGGLLRLREFYNKKAFLHRYDWQKKASLIGVK